MFTCVFPPVISSIFGKSFRFPFPYFVLNGNRLDLEWIATGRDIPLMEESSSFLIPICMMPVPQYLPFLCGLRFKITVFCLQCTPVADVNDYE